MSSYYGAAVCGNGHTLTRTLQNGEHTDEFCSKCGSKVFYTCSCCGEIIRGDPCGTAILRSEYPKAPAYCPKCGNPYPWTDKAIFSLIQALKEENEVSEELIEKLEKSMPDAIAETPGTGLAATRFGRAMKTAGSFTANAIKDFIIAFGCEALKSQLGL